MSFTAILFALLIEQARPLASGNAVHAAIRAWLRWSSKNFDAGRVHHAWLAWGFAVGGPTLLALGVHWLLMVGVGWPAAVLWNIAVLYVTLGFRQFSHHFTGIRDALDAGEEAQARERLAKWRQMDASELPRSEIVRHVIEHSVLAAHWHVFGVLGWFSVLAALGLGPAGAVLYRLSEFVTRYWRHRSRLHLQPVSAALQEVSTLAWNLIDWLPARVTALGFAVVGSFEEAIDAWRTYTESSSRPHPVRSTCAWELRRSSRLQRQCPPTQPRRILRNPLGLIRVRSTARLGKSLSSPTCAASSAWFGAQW
jgi:adenosylcobinamide-phosphate synthase